MPRPWGWALLGIAVSGAALWGAARGNAADETPDPREVAAGEVHAAPPFLVRVEVDHPDAMYREGEEILVRVRSERAGYLYLFYCDVSRQVSCLFPNQVQSDNRLPAQQIVQVPAPDSRFRLRVGPPFGAEVLKALVTTQPLQALELSALTKSAATPLAATKLKAVFVEVKGDAASPNRDVPRLWSEHHVRLTTVGRADAAPSPPRLQELPGLEGLVTPSRPPPPAESDRRQKRIGVFVGVGTFEDAGIRSLAAAPRDAQAMAAALRTHGRLDETVVLTNEQATLANLRHVLLDACHAGAAGGDRRKGVHVTADDLVRDLATDDYGVVVMCSSMGREVSRESSEHQQGFFTLALVEALRGKADYNGDGIIYLTEIDAYVSDRVKELTLGQQHPVTTKPATIRSFPLSRPLKSERPQ